MGATSFISQKRQFLFVTPHPSESHSISLWVWIGMTFATLTVEHYETLQATFHINDIGPLSIPPNQLSQLGTSHF